MQIVCLYEGLKEQSTRRHHVNISFFKNLVQYITEMCDRSCRVKIEMNIANTLVI